MNKLKQKMKERKKKREEQKNKDKQKAQAQEHNSILPYDLFEEQRHWVNWAYQQDEYGVKMLLTAREYGKTDCISVLGIIEQLEQNPNLTFIVMSRTATKSRFIVSTIGKILERRGHKGVFSETRVNLENRTHESKQPSVLSLAMSTSLKMYHCDYLVFDDPLDPEDEFSKKWRERAFIRFQELSGAIAKRVIVLGQYVSEDDLYCYLEKQTGVAVHYAWRGTIPKLDKDLDQFRKEGKTERWIAKNYLGILLKDESFPFVDIMVGDFGTPAGSVFAYLDPSFTGGDYTALSIGWYSNGKIAVVGKVWKRSWEDIADEIAHLCKQYKVGYLCYEGNSLGFVPDSVFYSKGLLSERIVNTKNKMGRIYRLGYSVKQKQIVIDLKSDPEYINQIKSFREGCLFDDAPDSLEGLVKQME